MSAQVIESQLAKLGKTLKFLSRGRHPGVNKVLDWLVRDGCLNVLRGYYLC